jgi:hypothetical protein
MSRNIIFVLKYHRHTFLDLIKFAVFWDTALCQDSCALKKEVEGSSETGLRCTITHGIASQMIVIFARLRYKAQPVNAVWGNSHCLL